MTPETTPDPPALLPFAAPPASRPKRAYRKRSPEEKAADAADARSAELAVSRFAVERALRLTLMGGREPRSRHQRLLTSLAGLVAWHGAEPHDHYSERVTAAFLLLSEAAPAELKVAYKVVSHLRLRVTPARGTPEAAS